MTSFEASDESIKKSVCGLCVRESYLSHEIDKRGALGHCTYCTAEGPVISIDELAQRVKAAFHEHYVRTAEYPDGPHYLEWSRKGQPVVEAIMDAGEIRWATAQDIQAILEHEYSDTESAEMGVETEFAVDSYYEAKKANDQAWQEAWHQFEASLKTEARFFNKGAADHLAKVFGHLDQLKTSDAQPLIVQAGPGHGIADLYRARVFISDIHLRDALCRPDLRLGPPPAEHAAAGRMNARGVSVFYGTTEADVAIAEVRPPVGSRVAVARFDITRPIQLLDLTALPRVHQPGSIFDPTYGSRAGRATFLRSLKRRMVRPVMPGGEEFEYLATQAIADFLANENEPLLDGIIFPSVQAGHGINIALFHKAAVVEAMDLPQGTKLSAHLEAYADEETEPDYWVSERVASSPKGLDELLETFDKYVERAGYEQLTETLRVDPNSVMVYHVTSAKFGFSSFRVTRHRQVKRSAITNESPDV